jgi:hypothetical protein
MGEIKRLFASDFDGTLSRGGVSEENKEAIRRFRAGGGVFCVVTGRSVGGSEGIFREVDLDFILCCNGAALCRPDGKARAFAGYDSAVFRDLWKCACELGSRGFGPQAVDGSVWIETADENGGSRLEEFIARHDTVCQCNMVFDTLEKAAYAADLINAQFGDTVNALQNGGSVDIPPRGIDKGRGVRRLAADLGIDEDNIYAAGDQMNDFAMVSAFCGFAMEGAPETLAAAAKKTVGSVAEAIDMILKGEL